MGIWRFQTIAPTSWHPMTSQIGAFCVFIEFGSLSACHQAIRWWHVLIPPFGWCILYSTRSFDFVLPHFSLLLPDVVDIQFDRFQPRRSDLQFSKSFLSYFRSNFCYLSRAFPYLILKCFKGQFYAFCLYQNIILYVFIFLGVTPITTIVHVISPSQT